jgi:UDP-N-acetylglucosamine enolpyruvyl transferase
MRQFDYNKYLKNNPLLKEAKNVKKDGDEIWFSDENYFKKEHEGYKLKPTDMVSVGDSKAMTYAQAKKKFANKINEDINEITQEDVFEILKQMGAKIDALHAQFIQMKQDLQSGDRSITASRVLDTAIKTFEEVDAISDAATAFGETKKPMKEYDKDSGPQMEELLKMLKDLQEKNKEIKAVGTRTLEKMIADLEMEIRRLPNMDKNISQYNTD